MIEEFLLFPRAFGKEFIHRRPISLIFIVKADNARDGGRPHSAKESKGGLDSMAVALFTFEKSAPVHLKIQS